MQGYESKSAATTVFSMREKVKQTISIISIDTVSIKTTSAKMHAHGRSSSNQEHR